MVMLTNPATNPLIPAIRTGSLAETFRRGAELLLQVYPDEATAPDAAWTPPTSKRVGWKGLSAAQLHDAAIADGDPRFA